MDYILQGNLSVAGVLHRFVNSELLPGTNIEPKKFWDGLDKYVHELTPKNKELLEFREDLQKKIDDWHRDKKDKEINIKEYSIFLENIGYLKKEGEKFQIETKNVDNEIAKIAGPQLMGKFIQCFIWNRHNFRIKWRRTWKKI